ncbi:uncharacterized protein PG998_012092 [Apiospora kogelbergensis]|uniref:Uncharacterized protein n=1 Tax=Apiospora kogelbergensis TaxID=1337665 RepID=A0AAW0QP57_9PEZI
MQPFTTAAMGRLLTLAALAFGVVTAAPTGPSVIAAPNNDSNATLKDKQASSTPSPPSLILLIIRLPALVDGLTD